MHRHRRPARPHPHPHPHAFSVCALKGAPSTLHPPPATTPALASALSLSLNVLDVGTDVAPAVAMHTSLVSVALLLAPLLASAVPLDALARMGPALSPTSNVTDASAGVRTGISLPLLKYDRYAARYAKRTTPEDAAQATLQHAHSQASYLRAKYGRHNTSSIPDSQAKRGNAPLTVVGTDSYYYAPVGFGTPTQTLAIVLDTGSSTYAPRASSPLHVVLISAGDLWIASNACTSQGCNRLPKFVTGESSTLRTSNQPFQIQYGLGATRGHLASDRVELAGYAVANLTFALASDVAQGTLSAPASGLMGMALGTLSSAQVTPFWEVLAKQGLLPEKVFSFQLARNERVRSGTSQGPGGVFTLGKLDHEQYSGDIHWVPMPRNMERIGYWALSLQRLTLGSETITSDPLSAAIDTGTTLVAVPTSVAQALYRAVPDAAPLSGEDGFFGFPCRTEVKVSLTFGGRAFEIDPQDFNAGAVDALGRTCLGAIFAMDTQAPTPAVIAGDAFLKNWFTAFELESSESSGPRIGFAALRRAGQAQTLSSTASVVTATTHHPSAQPTASPSGVPLSNVPAGTPHATGTGIYYGSGFASPSGSASDGRQPAPSANRENASLSSAAVGLGSPSWAIVLASAFALLGALI